MSTATPEPETTRAIVVASNIVSVWMKVEIGGKRYISGGEGPDVSSAVADAQRNVAALIPRG